MALCQLLLKITASIMLGGEGIAAITSRKLLEAEIIRGKIDI